MDPSTAVPLPNCIRSLPGYMRAHLGLPGVAEQHFVRWLFQVLETNLDLAEAIAEHSNLLVDPDGIGRLPERVANPISPLNAPGVDSLLIHKEGWELDALRWLAAWVGLQLEPEWLCDASTKDAQAPTNRGSARRYDKVATLIRRAVPLYRERGTKAGLQALLKEYYDWDVEIIERAWPQGMQIGVTSSIECNSWLLDEPNLDHQFVALVKLTGASHRHVSSVGTCIEAQLLGTERHDRRIDCYVGSGPRSADHETTGELFEMLTHLRLVINREIPAHLDCFVAFDHLRSQPAGAILPPFTIGVESAIGLTWIN